MRRYCPVLLAMLFMATFGSTPAARAQLIHTVAGGGPTGSIPATSAGLNNPNAIAVDSNRNITYVVTQIPSRVVKVDSSGLLTVVAGNEGEGYSGDGAATNAELSYPQGVAVDVSGNVYIADTGNSRIRVVNTQSSGITVAGVMIGAGDIATVAGGGSRGLGDSGPATNAELEDPYGVAVDSSGNIYIADTYDYRIRKVDATGGTITTVVGNGTYGSSTGGPATSASIAYVYGLALDSSNNIYYSQYYEDEYCEYYISGVCQEYGYFYYEYIAAVNTGSAPVVIAGISIPAGDIARVAGTDPGYSGDGGAATAAALDFPRGLAVDNSGNIYIADQDNSRIRMVNTSGIINTVAGNGAFGYSGDGGAATSAGLDEPEGVAADSSGNIYIADAYNGRVRVANTSMGTNTVAGVSIPAGDIATVAGGGAGDGYPATSAELYYPQGVAVGTGTANAGNIYISDSDNSRIRVVNKQAGDITVAGVTIHPGDIATVAGTGTFGYSGDGGPATSAELGYPTSVAVDSAGNIYIADSDDSRIRVVNTQASGTITVAGVMIGAGDIATVAGGGSSGLGDGGAARNAQLEYPTGVALDGAGNIYIADTDNSRIRKVTNGGTISTVAGNGTASYSGDGGAATSAELYYPYGVAVDSAGNIYIADSENNRIRVVNTQASGTITVAGATIGAGDIATVAGGGTSYPGDGGAATSAELEFPWGVAVDAFGNIYIADSDAQLIQVVNTQTSGTITVAGVTIGAEDINTIGGDGNYGYNGDEIPATTAWLADPFGIALDAGGNIYFADYDNQRIRKIDAASSGPATHFTVSAASPETAGSPFTFTVTALDASNNAATSYTGTVNFTSNDPSPTLPMNYTFVAGDNGVHTFTNGATLTTAGAQMITATDTVTGSITGSASITVNPGSATHFTVSAASPETAGSPFTFTVTALDASNNTATSYTGTAHFTTNDPGAGVTLPANYTFVAGDNGAHTFTNGATLTTSGAEMITATDTVTGSITGSASITVNPGSATHFTVSAASPETAGSPFSVTVTALDQFNNTATGYRGTAHFTTNDPGAGVTLPANYTFVAGDNGAHTFTNGATLTTSGAEMITATDTVTGSITGSASITVNPGSATHFTVSAASPETAGSPFSVTVTALDQFNNTATGYRGTAHFTTNDPGAGVTLPANYTFVAGDNGAHTFTNGATLTTSGAEMITATDTVTGSITGSASITVNPGSATHFTVSAASPETAGSPFSVTVTALDQFNNTATGYRGTAHFTTNDPGAGVTLPANYTFVAGDNGAHTFTNGATLTTSGAEMITATDTVTGSITGSASITVNPGSATHFTVSATSPETAGSPFNFTVTALDLFNNIATNYLGTVHFTSTDVLAALPGDTGLMSGTGTFSATLNTGDTQTITATDTVNSSITGTSGGIVTSSTAAFVTSDKTTEGNWMGVYGKDGYDIANGPENPANGTLSYGTFAVQGQSNWTWAQSTGDKRALETDAQGDRIAATWYSGTSFSFDVNLTDGQQHEVSLYLLDWDTQGRGENVTITDANNPGNPPLDTRIMPDSGSDPNTTNTMGTNFVNGTYLIWNISGHVTITVTRTAGPNGVVAGIFFGGGGPPPTGSAPSASATNFTTDSATGGNWIGTYGGDGYSVSQAGQSLPSYDTNFAVLQENNYVWNANPGAGAASALETGTDGTSSRIAATWYSSAGFSFDVNLSDGQPHRVALYALDWDNQGRSEQVKIQDASSGATLDTESVSNFTNGVYLIWTITGHVTITVTPTGGPNAAISGVFWGGTSVPVASATATWVNSDVSTQGAWMGKYGSNGYALANAGQNFLIPATFAVQGSASPWTWESNPNPSDPKDLETDNQGHQIAATWYSSGSFSFDLNLTDGNTHQVAIYVMDWDNRGRAETVQISDANSNSALDTARIIPDSSTNTSATNFLNGAYLIWNVKGHVIIKITSNAGPNAVVSGMFID